MGFLRMHVECSQQPGNDDLFEDDGIRPDFDLPAQVTALRVDPGFLRNVAAVEQEMYSIDETADIFRVGISFVKKMLNRHRAGESLEPRHGGGADPLLNEQHLEMLRAAVDTRADATLEEFQQFIASECRVAVSVATVCRALQILNLPRKKKSRGQRTRPQSAPRLPPESG